MHKLIRILFDQQIQVGQPTVEEISLEDARSFSMEGMES